MDITLSGGDLGGTVVEDWDPAAGERVFDVDTVDEDDVPIIRHLTYRLLVDRRSQPTGAAIFVACTEDDA